MVFAKPRTLALGACLRYIVPRAPLVRFYGPWPYTGTSFERRQGVQHVVIGMRVSFP